MSQPWLKFFPSDWRADPALRMCSLSARGLWMEMLCVMHSSEPYGSLLVNGTVVTDRQLASLCGATVREVHSRLAELETAGVFSRQDNGTIYSRRMRRDLEKAEQDKANGRGGGNPSLKRGVNPPDKAQKLEARSQKPEAEVEQKETRAIALGPDWPADYRDQFWRAYPHKIGKADAFRKLDRLARNGKVAFRTMMFGLDAYLNKTDDRPWCNPGTWLNQGRWTDEPAAINGKRSHHPQRSAAGDFFAGLASLATDGAGDGEIPRAADPEIPRGRFEIDG